MPVRSKTRRGELKPSMSLIPARSLYAFNV